MIDELNIAASGAILLGHAVIGLYFLRFWRQTRERLFGWFAVAFFILAVERIIIITVVPEIRHHPLFYCTRLVAFLVIAWAIWDRNRSR
jgi:hypothetical protein